MKRCVLFVPGLGDNGLYASAQCTALILWRTAGVRPSYFAANWHAPESYEEKLQRLLALIDDSLAANDTVSLVAASAGSSLALAAFQKRSQAVHAVVSVCGKLNNVQTVGADLFAANPAFKESLQNYARAEQKLTPADRNKILVVRASGDTYVPAGDGEVAGAHRHLMHTAGHAFSIFMALTFLRRPIIRFTKR